MVERRGMYHRGSNGLNAACCGGGKTEDGAAAGPLFKQPPHSSPLEPSHVRRAYADVGKERTNLRPRLPYLEMVWLEVN